MTLRLAALLMALALPAHAKPAFEDLSDTLPPHQYTGGWEHFVGGGLSVFDCDGDALPEIVAAGGTTPAILLRNGGDMAFATDPAFPQITATIGLYPIDLDADGHKDLYVLRAGVDVVLTGGPDCAFTVAELPGLGPQPDQWSTAFTAWWQDDGLPTLAIGHYVDRTNPDGPFEACDDNILLVPDGTIYRSEILTPGFCALSMLAATDARGLPTLRLSNDRHYYVRDGYEQMWDITERRFLTDADGWPTVSLWGMGIASRDITGDDRDEVMLTSMGDQLLQLAQPDGTYAPAPYAFGTYAQRPHTGDDGRPSTGWHAEFGDVNNDGLPDLFIAKGNVDQMPTNATHDPNNLLMQTAYGFIETALEAGVATTERSRGAALADLDGDGLLDLVVNNRRAPMELYRNVTPDAGHWLTVALYQPGGNRDGVGARVVVETADTRQSQQVIIGGGHGGMDATPLHFGLGAADMAQVTVRWPDGSTSGPVEIPADTHLSMSPEVTLP